MNLNKIEKWATIFIVSTGIFVSVLLVETIFLAFFSQFRTPFIHLSLIPASVTTILFSNKIKKDIKLLPKITPPILFIIFFISLIMVFYPHDTFGGRDESLYSNYAVYLAQNASLNVPSHLDYSPNYYAKNIKITPPAYTIYLATQKIFFGVHGILRGNLIIIILGLSSLFLVSSYIGGKINALITVLLFSSSMPFLWFSRETMTENLAFFLLWSSILFIFLFIKFKRGIYLTGLFINSWIFALTRLEGFFIQFVIFLILPFILSRTKTLNLTKVFFTMSIYLLLILSTLFIAKNTFGPFLKTIFPEVSYGIKQNLSSFLPKGGMSNNMIPPILRENEKSATFSSNFLTFLVEMLAKYNFLLIIVSIPITITNFLIKLKKTTKIKVYFFTALIIILPEFYKIISPSVTIDQPWLYRRYLYALLPFGYLCFTIFLSRLKNMKLLIILSSGLFIINIILSNSTLFLKNNWTLIDKIDNVTKDISQKDLVVKNYQRPLGYYATTAFLLLQKGARVLDNSELTNVKFVPENKTFNDIPYERIFLLSTLTNNEKDYPLFKVTEKKDIDVSYTQLIPSCQLPKLGDQMGYLDIYNFGAYSYSDVKKYCSQPKNEIIKYKEKLYLYELIYKNEKS